MRIASGAPATRMLSLGDYRPSRVVTNDEIAPRIDSSDKWIRDRTGFVSRRFAADETVADMATAAGDEALKRSGVPADEIDLVIVANCTHPYQTPGASSEVQDRLHATKAGAMDLNAACAGFCYMLATASDMIRAGTARYVLAIGSEKLTDFIDPFDRTMAFLFGDGAGAAVVGPSDEPGIGPVAWGSHGDHIKTITQEPNYAQVQQIAREGGEVPPVALRMDGQTVFRWASYEMKHVAHKALELADVKPDELGAFIPHQANLRIVQALVRSLGLPDHVVIARDGETQGNTSSASIPLALHALVDRGEVRSGDPALLLGFGAGLTFAGQVALIP